MSAQSNNASGLAAGLAAGLVPKSVFWTEEEVLSVLSAEIAKDPSTFVSSSTSYESPVKQPKPPNEREAPGAPVREARVAKRKNEHDLHLDPLDPYENSPTCSRTLFPPN